MSDGVTSTDVADIRDCREMTRRWAGDLGVQDEDLDAVVERVEEALHGILSDTRGRWLLEGEGESELRLTGLVDRRVETVILDRIRIDGDGTHWIVDYKTSTHEGGDVEGFLQQEADRYRPQLARYAAIYSAMTGVTPKTALYFPLLRAFTEIDV